MDRPADGGQQARRPTAVRTSSAALSGQWGTRRWHHGRRRELLRAAMLLLRAAAWQPSKVCSQAASGRLLPPTECSLRSGCAMDERHGGMVSHSHQLRTQRCTQQHPGCAPQAWLSSTTSGQRARALRRVGYTGSRNVPELDRLTMRCSPTVHHELGRRDLRSVARALRSGRSHRSPTLWGYRLFQKACPSS